MCYGISDQCGIEFPANKAILSSSSKFLESVLINAFDPHPKLFLQGVKNEDMRLILDYIYTGVVEVEEKSVARLMEIGSQLQILSTHTCLHPHPPAKADF